MFYIELSIIAAFFCDEIALFSSIEHPPTMYVSASLFCEIGAAYRESFRLFLFLTVEFFGLRACFLSLFW